MIVPGLESQVPDHGFLNQRKWSFDKTELKGPLIQFFAGHLIEALTEDQSDQVLYTARESRSSRLRGGLTSTVDLGQQTEQASIVEDLGLIADRVLIPELNQETWIQTNPMCRVVELHDAVVDSDPVSGFYFYTDVMDVTVKPGLLEVEIGN